MSLATSGSVIMKKGGFASTMSPNATDNVTLSVGNTSGVIAVTSDLPSVLNANKYGDYFMFWDAESTPGTTSVPLVAATSGSGSTVSTANVSTFVNTAGVQFLSTGTTATGRCATVTGGTNHRAGSGSHTYSAGIALPALSSSTQRYQIVAGFVNTATTAVQTNGAYFLYDEGGVHTGSTESGNWQLVAVAGGTRTVVQTTRAVAASTTDFTALRIEINTAGTVCDFYVDDVLVGTISTNLPVGAANLFGCGLEIFKQVGTTAALCYVDWISHRRSFSTATRRIPSLNSASALVNAPPTSATTLTASSQILSSTPSVLVTAATDITLGTNCIAPGLPGQKLIIFYDPASIRSVTIPASIAVRHPKNMSVKISQGQYAEYVYYNNAWQLCGTSGLLQEMAVAAYNTANFSLTFATAFTDWKTVSFTTAEYDPYVLRVNGLGTPSTSTFTVKADGWYEAEAMLIADTAAGGVSARYLFSLFVNGAESKRLADVYSTPAQGVATLSGSAKVYLTTSSQIDFRAVLGAVGTATYYGGSQFSRASLTLLT